MEFIKPEFKKSAYHCPHCNVYAEQKWSLSIDARFKNDVVSASRINEIKYDKLIIARCSHCQDINIWYNMELIFPVTSLVGLPNPDMPEEVKNLYYEARDVFPISKRASFALLRLALQRLCIFLGEKGNRLNDDIESLVKKGLPVQIKKALDIVRVTGNHAVHPGLIEFADQHENDTALFDLLNFICAHFISNPKAVDAMYSKLPDKDRKNINARDSK